MKKKLSLFVAIFSMVALISPSLALALEVEITPQGTIIFYQGAVLGDSDEKTEFKREEKREEKKEEKKEEKREEKKAERQEIKRTSGANKEVRVMPVKAEEARKIEAQKYKVSVEERKKKSELKAEAAKQEAEIKQEQEKFIKREEAETDDIKMQFPAPAEVRVEQKRQPEPERETETERETEDEMEQNQESERVERPSALDAKINEYQQKLQEKRSEMKGKMIEIRNEVSGKKDELRMKSGEIKAKAQEGAGFVVDSETNEVRVVTPSGQEKVLNHLPDEAIQRMQEKGVLQAGQGVESTLEPTIKTSEDGSLKYVVPVTKEKRLFGLFKRQVPAEVELDDTTGEVVEREQAPKSSLQRFLKIFEF